MDSSSTDSSDSDFELGSIANEVDQDRAQREVL